MKSIYDILTELRATATSERNKGDKFERLMLAFLTTDPVWSKRFGESWLWSEWPGRAGRPDTGIDLVAQDRETNGLCAIQCKFYDPAHTLQKKDIDSFFTASGKAGFNSRLIISTTDHWSVNAEEALSDQQIPATRLRVQDLDDSDVDWSQFSLERPERLILRAKKQTRPYQAIAIDAAARGFATFDRGRLIMACGTGKTFTALKISETQVPLGGSVLFLVPSISLLSQTIREWSSSTTVPIRPFAVCSDNKAGKRTESEDIGAYDLAYPASTDPDLLLSRVNASATTDATTVVFSTYQSLPVLSAAQEKGLSDFDLIVCDEAHRTTGVTLAGTDESNFVRVHDQTFLRGNKRLYMTATPRIYEDSTKSKASEADAVLCSMDDEGLYGPEFHRLGFGDAVEQGLLSDYKVLVLAVDEKAVTKTFQSQLADKNHELTLDDAAKIVGCWNGLSKRGVSALGGDVDNDSPMRRAVAFTRTIKESKRLASMFGEITNQYAAGSGQANPLTCEAAHVDGTFNALERNQKLDWLKASTNPRGNICRVLSNARCLSEGVDVPALDAVIFVSARNSQVDVVQSVGRVMRLATDKQYGYVILPIGIPADLTPEEALRDNQKYKVVWQVLQALRAHDDRFNAMVNQIELNQNKNDKLQIIGVGESAGFDSDGSPTSVQGVLHFPHLEEWREAIYARVVQKVGDRRYWEDWARDVSVIAERHATRIKGLLDDPTNELSTRFATFLEGLQANLNDSITRSDAIDMLSQHLITKPVFEALFTDFSFVTQNPVSQVMQEMLDALDEQSLNKESATLDRFYESVRLRAEGIDNAEGKQRIVTELYEKFFKNAFPRVAESLGIVYTPIEIVDFIIRSVEDTLRIEFGASINDSGVHVLDPFTGTGTFIVRLLQSGLISKNALLYKYTNELHANELVLLAYYIAAINIEATLNDIAGGDYVPFEGIVLTDTFQTSEANDSLDEWIFPQNNDRLVRQKQADIRVILGNPPYSVGQGSENDANKNLKYPTLDERIRATYAALSSAGLKRNLYDSYIRAFRWASDRIADRGVVCFVSNGSFVDSPSHDGFRKALGDEFSAVYCFNLRGNQRTSGEVSRKEGGKVFGGGSRTPVAITLLVKNPDSTGKTRLAYYDIGDYLTREQKLARVADMGSASAVPWSAVTASPSGDWINQRNVAFDDFTPLGDKRDADAETIFDIYSLGVVTNRDAWTYNFSRISMLANMERMIAFYNAERLRFNESVAKGDAVRNDASVATAINTDTTKVSWTRALKSDVRKDKSGTFNANRAVVGMYRPFCKQWLYFDRQFNEMVYQVPKLFPTTQHHNLVISLNAADARKAFGALITDVIPNLALSDPGQCFPLYRYESVDQNATIFSANQESKADDAGFVRKSGISERTLERYRTTYGPEVDPEDIFFYVYGILHSREYKASFAADLKKVMPRIPMAADFLGFARAGKELADLHLAYESIEPWPLEGLPDVDTAADILRVDKMRFVKTTKNDRSTIQVNSNVRLSGIPDEAYAYDIHGKSAIEWVVDRYQVKTDKASGLVNDPNTWSNDPHYIVDLVARVTRVSVESARIIANLPSVL